MLERIKTLESLSQPDVPSHLLRLSQYGLRSASDFDKYHALNLAEAAAREAHRVHDSKASFLDAAIQTLRSHVSISLDKFQAYFTALFCDKDYTKILECIARVDKVFQTKAPASRSSVERPDSPRPARSGRVVCFHCGIPGHIAPNCFRRRRESGWQSNAPLGRRFAPYPRLLGQSQQDQSSNNSPRR